MRQQHSKDGSVRLTFSAVIVSPDVSQSGTLQIVSADNAAWSKSSVVDVPEAGRNIIPVEVHLRRIACYATQELGSAWEEFVGLRLKMTILAHTIQKGAAYCSNRF